MRSVHDRSWPGIATTLSLHSSRAEIVILRWSGAELGREACRYLAAQMTTLLFRGELILEVHACRPGLNHLLHELKAVQGPAKASLSICHYGCIPAKAAAL